VDTAIAGAGLSLLGDEGLGNTCATVSVLRRTSAAGQDNR
jgi:hypothetical protein